MKRGIDWDQYDPNMLVNFSDAKYYYETFTEENAVVAETNRQAIATLDGRVTKVEQEIPGGGGGTGAYLNLGGTPERYPTSEEMNEGGKEVSFLVVARTDGIYFMNPLTKSLIKPKKGGGSLAIHGHFPQIFDSKNTIKYDGRIGMSGVYTAVARDVGLNTSGEHCKLLIAVHKDGTEHQTIFGEHILASRVFIKGAVAANWSTDVRDGPIYRGPWDPTTGAYPAHSGTNSRWDVVFDPSLPTVDFSGLTWRPGDRLVYAVDSNKYTQMHTTSGVTSVNGKSGNVHLNADDVGAMKHTPSAVVNCDDLIKAGSYGVAGGSTNWAFGSTAGALMIFSHNTSYLTQLACSAADNKMRVRTCNAGRWSSWHKIYSELEKPTAAEVQAVNLNYGVGAAGKDVASANTPEIKGGIFNSGAKTEGAYADYMPFIQGARAGGSDGTGQMLQIQANHLTKKLAYRTRVQNNWTDWVEPYSNHNKPNTFELNGMGCKEFDGDLNTIKEAGSYRFSSGYTNGPQDADGGNKPTYSQLLHVKGGGDTNWQMIGDFRGKELWWRGYNDSFLNGGDWHRVYHSGRPPTFDELELPYASRNKYDVRDFGVVGDGVTDDTDAFVRACNTVYGYNGTLTAPGNLHIKLNGVKRTVTIRCNLDFNNATIDLSDFEGMVMFSRKVIDPITCWGAGKDPANPSNPTHPLILALQSEEKLQGGALKGWEDIAEVEDSYFMINTEEPLFSYRGGIKNRCEYNKIGRWGLLESFIKYPMDPKKISRIMYWPMEKQMTIAQNIVWKLGSNDLQSPNVRIRTSNFTAKNWKFLQDNFINTKMNPTVVAVERSANIVLEDISFQWATHSTATTGFTYNMALNDNYNVSLKRVTGTGDGWGATGSNNSRKVYFEQCNLSRIDFHEPMHEYLSLRDCHVGSWGVLATAMGDINIEGGTLFRKRNPRTVDRNGFIRSRTDSGFCDGNINIRNVTIETDQPGVSNLLIHQNDAPDQDFVVPGSPVDFCFWKNITIDNVKFVGPEGSSLNLYPTTNCSDMASSGMRWPYTVNITNCTGGNLSLEGDLNGKILPYKEQPDADKGFVGNIPNHIINVTESNLGKVDITDSSPVQKFVVALNMDNINPSAKEVKAPSFTTSFGGSASLRNSTINSVDFGNPSAPLFATLDGCKVVHTGDFNPGIINGDNDNVELSVVNSSVSTNTFDSLDGIKKGRRVNNVYYIAGVQEVIQDTCTGGSGGTGGGTGGATSFVDLSDTPSGYHPGKLLGYNLSANALIPVDNSDRFTLLKDTPSEYRGKATNVLTVKTDESGLEFTPFPTGGTDLGPVTDRLDDHETRIDVLENTPPVVSGKNKFSELDDTPSGYSPGKMLAYNMAGNAIVGVDAVDEFKGLRDTPSSYNGNAQKALTVKSDESGLEFVSMPNLAPMQTEINGLHNSIIRVGGEQAIQDQRLDALESLGSNGPRSFVELNDTPINYTGQAGMLLGVNATEDGLEYIEDSAVPIMNALEAGNLPIKWNNMKQKIAASSSTISTSQIAENAFVIGLGGLASRRYDLPDIVDADTSPLPASSVREGRLTVLSQQGTGNRTVALTAGCKFNSAGVTSTTNMLIKSGQTLMLLPAIYGNGDKIWTVIGCFSANDVSYGALFTRLETSEANVTSLLARVTALEALVNP